jgi:L-asparaginase II
MANPVIAEVTRGPIVESRHTGAFAVVEGDGRLMHSRGDIDAPIYPRSAIKAFQCLPLIASGAADRFGLLDEEIALCCASHNGEADHVRVARAILGKAGRSESDLECGAHWPYDHGAQRALVKQDAKPSSLHNNCSGKHAGMIALSVHLGVDPAGYAAIHHRVQREMAASIAGLCRMDADSLPHGIDGCSVPTWAFPLKAMAQGFASLSQSLHGRRIMTSVGAHPWMVAGTGRYDTQLMEAVPRAFVKVGAEGVYGACVPHAGLGLALKCDDGAARAAEVAMAAMLASLDVWEPGERAALERFAVDEMKNWRKISVGDIHAIRF